MFARGPVRHLADRAGRRLGRLYFISLSINKVRVLKGVCQSSFTLRNNPKLTKNHVRRPVSRRASGCACNCGFGLCGCAHKQCTHGAVKNGACRRTLAMVDGPLITKEHVRH